MTQTNEDFLNRVTKKVVPTGKEIPDNMLFSQIAYHKRIPFEMFIPENKATKKKVVKNV